MLNSSRGHQKSPGYPTLSLRSDEGLSPPHQTTLVGMQTAFNPAEVQKATGTQRSSRRQVVSDSSSNDSEADSSPEDEEEKKEASPPAGGGKKRKASPTREAEGSKRGKTLPPDCSANASDDDGD